MVDGFALTIAFVSGMFVGLIVHSLFIGASLHRLATYVENEYKRKQDQEDWWKTGKRPPFYYDEDEDGKE